MELLSSSSSPCSFFIIFMTLMINFSHGYQNDWSKPELEPLKNYYIFKKNPSNTWSFPFFIPKNSLHKPYDFLLTQPLMTIGLTQYYARTPKIRMPLYAINNEQEKLYSRAIVMIIDNNKSRNDAILADKMNESTIVELGLITMNFKALPDFIVKQILKSRTPLGALLHQNNIKIHATNTLYFQIKCDSVLAQDLHCAIGKMLYGRINTLIRNDNKMWIARDVEILGSVLN